MTRRSTPEPYAVFAGFSPRAQTRALVHSENVPDLYELLGVTPHASTREIKRAYRKLAIVRHRKGAIAIGEELAAMQGALEVLCDPERRRAYDAARTVAPSLGPATGVLIAHARETAEHSARLSRQAVAESAAAMHRFEVEQSLIERRAARRARRLRALRAAILIAVAIGLALAASLLVR